MTTTNYDRATTPWGTEAEASPVAEPSPADVPASAAGPSPVATPAATPAGGETAAPVPAEATDEAPYSPTRGTLEKR